MCEKLHNLFFIYYLLDDFFELVYNMTQQTNIQKNNNKEQYQAISQFVYSGTPRVVIFPPN